MRKNITVLVLAELEVIPVWRHADLSDSEPVANEPHVPVPMSGPDNLVFSQLQFKGSLGMGPIPDPVS
jgi:hypothetical protein